MDSSRLINHSPILEVTSRIVDPNVPTPENNGFIALSTATTADLIILNTEKTPLKVVFNFSAFSFPIISFFVSSLNPFVNATN